MPPRSTRKERRNPSVLAGARCAAPQSVSPSARVTGSGRPAPNTRTLCGPGTQAQRPPEARGSEPGVVSGSEIDGQGMQGLERPGHELGRVRQDTVVLVEVAGAEECIRVDVDGEFGDPHEDIAQPLTASASHLAPRPGEGGVEVKVCKQDDAHARCSAPENLPAALEEQQGAQIMLLRTSAPSRCLRATPIIQASGTAPPPRPIAHLNPRTAASRVCLKGTIIASMPTSKLLRR